MRRLLLVAVAALISVFGLISAPTVAQGRDSASHHGDYLNAAAAAAAKTRCGQEVSKRAGNWLCPAKDVPANLKRVNPKVMRPMAAPWPFYVNRNGSWGQYANWDADYNLGGFAFGYGSTVVGYGSWYVHDSISGYAMQTPQFRIMISTSSTNMVFTAERLTTDSNPSGTPIPGTYNSDSIASLAANTQGEKRVVPFYDNTAQNMYVAHEITWQVPGYSGRWATWMKTFIMHNTSISGNGKYLYDIGGALPPDPEGGTFVS